MLKQTTQPDKQNLPLPSQAELKRQAREFEAAWCGMTGRHFGDLNHVSPTEPVKPAIQSPLLSPTPALKILDKIDRNR